MPVAPSAPPRLAWALFAPPALVLGLHWWLQWQAERHPQPAAWRLSLLPPPGTTALDVLLPWLLALGAVLALGLGLRWALRRWGLARLRPALLTAWALLCALAGAARWLQAHNLDGQPPLPLASAEVLGSRPRAPHQHSTGGTEVVLHVVGQAGPQQVLIDAPEAATWQAGQRLALQLTAGRYGGLYLRSWQQVPP